MSGPAIIGFCSTLMYSVFTVGFTFKKTQSATASVLKKEPIYFFTIGSLLLLTTIILELILLITKNDPTWQVRLAALDLTFVVALVVLTISVVKQDHFFDDWKSSSSIFIYMPWFFIFVNIICNVVIFFSETCV